MRWISLILIILSFTASAQQFDTMPGTFARQGNVIWACLPVIKILVCAPINIDNFCQMDRPDYDRGVLSCSRPMMAEDKQEVG